MVNYYWTTDEGHRVCEYRPFDASRAVLYSPCMPSSYGAIGTRSYPAKPEAEGQSGTPDMLSQLTGQQLKFSYFSKDVLQKLLTERVALRNRNRAGIQGRLGDVAGALDSNMYIQSREALTRRQGLERQRLDLERQMRDEDITLWRDTLELRKELIQNLKAYEGTLFRSNLMDSMPSLDDHKGQTNTDVSG